MTSAPCPPGARLRPATPSPPVCPAVAKEPAVAPGDLGGRAVRPGRRRLRSRRPTRWRRGDGFPLGCIRSSGPYGTRDEGTGRPTRPSARCHEGCTGGGALLGPLARRCGGPGPTPGVSPSVSGAGEREELAAGPRVGAEDPRRVQVMVPAPAARTPGRVLHVAERRLRDPGRHPRVPYRPQVEEADRGREQGPDHPDRDQPPRGVGQEFRTVHDVRRDGCATAPSTRWPRRLRTWSAG